MIPTGMELRSIIPLILSTSSTVLGLAVGYLALRGYRQSNTRPMFFIALGFILVFWAPIFLFLGWFRTPVDDFVFGVIGELSRVAGLISILYGLWMPSRDE